MSITISLILLAVNSIFAFGKKNFRALAFIFFFFCWILFWGNTGNADYLVYRTMYETNADVTTTSLEIGFILLIKLSNIIGFNYNMFLFLISLTGFLLIHKTAVKY